MIEFKNNLNICKNLVLDVKISATSARYLVTYQNVTIPLILETQPTITIRIANDFAKAHSNHLTYCPNSLEYINSELYPCTLFIKNENLYIPSELYWSRLTNSDKQDLMLYLALPLGSECIVIIKNFSTNEIYKDVYDFERAKRLFNLIPVQETSTTNLF